MDPDSDWLTDDVEESAPTEVAPIAGENAIGSSDAAAAPAIPSGPPVPNPYAHILDEPKKTRQFTHWGRPTFLRYKILMEYYKNYYDDYIDYMNRRQRGLYRDVPRAQEWAERISRVYTRDGKKLSAFDYKYWLTDKNVVKPKCSIFHAVHSKDYYRRQYHEILI